MSNQTLRLALAGQALIEAPVAVTTAAASRLVEEISAADMAVTNFEATIDSPRAWPLKTKTLHVATPEAMQSLRKLGLNALALANNHAFDLGPPALAATRLQAQTCGFAAAGSGDNIAAAAAPAWVTTQDAHIALLAFDLGPQPEIVYAGAARPGINPLRIRSELIVPPDDAARLRAIARACGHEERMKRRVQVGYSEAGPADALDFFGISVKTGAAIAEHRYPDAQDLKNAIASIVAARAHADLVVVSAHYHHWEGNWARVPSWLEVLCVMLVQAGADVVFCHGPPVLQGMSFHDGHPIFYGLGNFIFHTARASRYDDAAVDVWHSVMAVCDFMGNRKLGCVRVHPIRVGPPTEKNASANALLAPELLEGAEADDVISRFLASSSLHDACTTWDSGACVITPSNLESG